MDPQVFKDSTLEKLGGLIKDYKERDWRFTNLCGSTVDDKVELLYTFSQGEELENVRILIDNDTEVPAVSPVYPVAFYFENEIHDLFGVDFKGITVDFGGEFFETSIPTPMNPLSNEAEQFLAERIAENTAGDATQGASEEASQKNEAHAALETSVEGSATQDKTQTDEKEATNG